MMSRGLENVRDTVLLGFGTNIFNLVIGTDFFTAPNQGQNVFATFALNVFFAPTDLMLRDMTIRTVFFAGGGTVTVKLITLIPIADIPNTDSVFTGGAQTVNLKDINVLVKRGEGIGVKIAKVGGINGLFSCFGSIYAEMLR